MTADMHLKPSSPLDASENEQGVERADLVRIAALLALAGAVWLFAAVVPSGILIGVGGVAVAVGAWPILHEAGENLLERRMTMELSMTIALAAALAIGEVLEGLTVARGRHAIEDLLSYLPADGDHPPARGNRRGSSI